MRLIESLRITDEAQVGAARRAVHTFAQTLGFDEKARAEIDIVVQEIGTNAARYAIDGGWLHYTTPLVAPGLELFYWDKGPGIYNLDRAVRDGVSTSGSLGAGFGALRRLSDEFDVYSTVRTTTALSYHAIRHTSHGTAILCRKRLPSFNPQAPLAARSNKLLIGAWSRSKQNETVNGDVYFVREHNGSVLLAVVDGLGHGKGAEDASKAAVERLGEWTPGEELDELVWAVHERLRGTRGAVMSVAVIDSAAGSLKCAGVGNVEVRAFDAPEPVRPISINGTLGMRLSKVPVWHHKWSDEATLVMASDGISASWDIASYPGLLDKDPQLLAGILVRDYGRDADDATALVVKC